MFNTGSFNKIRFNVSAADDSDVRLIENMVASVSGMVLTGGNLYVTSTANNSFAARTLAAAGVRVGPISMSDGFNVSAVGYVYSYLLQQMSGVFGAALWCSQDIRIVKEFASTMQDSAFCGVNKAIALAMYSEFGREAKAGIDCYQPATVMTSIMDAQVTSMIFDVSYVMLNVTIKPGQTLVIDSDNFIVLLDGEDVISAHSGIWPWLSRELFDMQVSSGAVSDLATSVLYTERYL